LSTVNVENVATPLTAATVSVPPRVPDAGFVPMASVIELVAEVTTLPAASSTLTVTAGVMTLPPATFVGWTPKANLLGVPAVTLKAELTALVRPADVAIKVYPVPALLTLRLENVATPLTAVTVIVPESVPLEGLVPIAMTIWLFADVTTLP
jgi:hypothetical protein